MKIFIKIYKSVKSYIDLILSILFDYKFSKEYN